jgi:hypothetical protein
MSVLTNFEELGVYDCTIRPRPNDKASYSRIQHFQCEQYPDIWRTLWDILSRDAVWSGAFDQFAASKRKRGTSEVDVEFLKDIEGWRESLARNIARHNMDLSPERLNTAVQLTIDRIVFLRMAEDRGLEPYQQLLKLCEYPDIYPRFIRELCRKADRRYNSGLFHFQKEPTVSEEPDRLTPKLTVDDKVLKPILESLYFEHGSPYHFGVLPVEILGTVYERFLGKVIRLTAGHQAKVDEKPEVRKAGGVYYTPSYIVDYIVKHTVGEQIKDRSPSRLAGGDGIPPFRILDMACGSGSFLLGAYGYLLDHCLKWYMEHKPDTHRKAVYKDARNGQFRLTVEEKKRILTRHVFGVDIDPQAVEVTKLSLLLRVLEGETDQSLSLSLLPFGDRALPNLADNIKCGNSLISPADLAGKLIPDPGELKRVNPFDWKERFPEAMKAGGFDCIIGNPLYIRIQMMTEWAPLEVELYKDLFKASKAGNYDIYVVFIEQGLKLLTPKGRLGFICPNKFFNSQYGLPIRKIVADGKHLSSVVHFGAQQVFDGTTYTCLLFLSKAPVSEFSFAKVDDLTAWKTTGAAIQGIVRESKVTSDDWNFAVGPGAKLIHKLSAMPSKLGDVADVFVGVQTSADDVYIMELVHRTERTYRLRSKALAREWTFEKNLLYPIVSGTDIRRYGTMPSRQYILFPYVVEDERAVLVEFKEIQRKYPKTAEYLLENKVRLESRESGAFRDMEWHRFGRSQNLGIQGRIKVCVPRLIDKLHASFDRDGSHFLDNVDVGGVTLKSAYTQQRLEYLLALLNSRLLQWYFPCVSAPFRGGWWSANRQFLSLVPIRLINAKNSRDTTIHGRIVTFVAEMETLQAQIVTAKSEAHKDVIRHQIKTIDADIDRLINELYGLTSEEIAIIGGSS